MFMVGSSIEILVKASGFSASATVSPISKSSKPVIAQISPQPTVSVFTLPNPSKTCNSLILIFLIVPSALQSDTCIPSFNVPLATLPMAILPTNEL